eukprot:750627-Hanusia_phi.AAC.6
MATKMGYTNPTPIFTPAAPPAGPTWRHLRPPHPPHNQSVCAFLTPESFHPTPMPWGLNFNLASLPRHISEKSQSHPVTKKLVTVTPGVARATS